MKIKDNFVILTKVEYQLQPSIFDEFRTTNEDLKAKCRIKRAKCKMGSPSYKVRSKVAQE